MRTSGKSPSQPLGGRSAHPLVGIHVDDLPFRGIGPLEGLDSALGRIDVVHWFQAWGGGHRSFRHDWLDLVAGTGRHALISWEPWVQSGEASQPRFAPASLLAGDHDDYIRSWAAGFAARDDGPWFLRPMHEMNGDWYPWSGGVPGADPAEFRTAWIHLHDLFTDAGATNVAWVWCPLADDSVGPFERYYPGSRYVDVLALDGYNWGSTRPEFGGWRSPAEIFDVAYERLTALGSQPVWIAEVSSAPEGGDKAAWFAELLTAGRYDRLEAVVLFNLDKERDWRVDHDPRVARAIRMARSAHRSS